jgi:hypothetical protein
VLTHALRQVSVSLIFDVRQKQNEARHSPFTSRGSCAVRLRTSYYDRNADGKVDREFHRFEGWADSDWELLDDDFDGRFEKKIRYGVGVLNSIVDISVPKGAPIEIVSEDKKK